MSSLKFDLNPLDSVMDKIDKTKIFTVLHEELHDVWLWREGEAPHALPKRMINLTYVKVDPKVAKVLYAESTNDISDTAKPTE